MADLLYIRTKNEKNGWSCFYVSDVAWLVVEMGVLHSIVEEGEGGLIRDVLTTYVTKENSVVFTGRYFD